MGKATGNVSLRLWTPQGATVAFVRQVAPSIEDLTDRAVPVSPLTADLSGLPVMLIQAGTGDPLLQEARWLAERARAWRTTFCRASCTMR